MSELFAALLILIAVVVTACDPARPVRKWWRLRRAAHHARGLPVRVPCDLRDRELTDGRWCEGYVELPPRGTGFAAYWRAKGRTTASAVDFPPLEPFSADELTVAFRSADGHTELRLHPDEAPMVLRVLGARP